jgi:hypothetical protein
MLRFVLSSVFVVGLVAAGSASAVTLYDGSIGILENRQLFTPSLTIPPGVSVDLRSEGAISLRPVLRGNRAGNGLFGRRTFVWHDEIPKQSQDHWHDFESFPGRSEHFPELVERFPRLLDRFLAFARGIHERWNDISDGTIRVRPTNTVPEPNAALLIGSGIVGIGLWRRSRR